jgi:hypothetical protein
MKAINAFAVFLRMAKTDDQALRLAPLSNVLNMKVVKAGTQVTIGVSGNALHGIMNGKFVGGLLLCDIERFDQLKAEMEQEP